LPWFAPVLSCFDPILARFKPALTQYFKQKFFLLLIINILKKSSCEFFLFHPQIFDIF